MKKFVIRNEFEIRFIIKEDVKINIEFTYILNNIYIFKHPPSSLNYFPIIRKSHLGTNLEVNCRNINLY